MKKPSTQLLRVQGLERAVAALPLREELVQEALALFREWGKLPEQQRLAGEVIRRALAPPPQPQRGLLENIDRLVEIARAHLRGELIVDPPSRARECLFHEAVYGNPLVRVAARIVLRWSVEDGADLTAPTFLADQEIPEYGGVGLHMLGYPQRYAKPPFEEQARRLFERLFALRRQMKDDVNWWDAYRDATVLFLRTGELPEDAFTRDVVLAAGELELLLAHGAGEKVHDILVAFDEAALCTPEQRPEALDLLSVAVRSWK